MGLKKKRFFSIPALQWHKTFIQVTEGEYFEPADVVEHNRKDDTGDSRPDSEIQVAAQILEKVPEKIRQNAPEGISLPLLYPAVENTKSESAAGPTSRSGRKIIKKKLPDDFLGEIKPRRQAEKISPEKHPSPITESGGKHNTPPLVRKEVRKSLFTDNEPEPKKMKIFKDSYVPSVKVVEDQSKTERKGESHARPCLICKKPFDKDLR